MATTMQMDGQTARVHSDETILTAHDASGATIARVENPSRAQRNELFALATAKDAAFVESYRSRYVSTDIKGVMGQRSGTVSNYKKYVRNVAGLWYELESSQKRKFY